MASYRQSGNGGVAGNGLIRNGVAPGQQQQPQLVSIGIHSGASHKHQQQSRHHHRRLKAGRRKILIIALIVFLFIAFVAAVIAFLFLSSQNKESNSYFFQDDDIGSDADFLTNVTRTRKSKVLKFGHGSVTHGRDSRYWDRDDRRRDEDYSEEDLEQSREDSIDKDHIPVRGENSDKRSSSIESHKGLHHKNSGLYNEAGRGELKRYEAEYEASLKISGKPKHYNSNTNQLRNGADVQNQNEVLDVDDEYDDGIDSQDTLVDEYSEIGHDIKHPSDILISRGTNGGESSAGTSRRNVEGVHESSSDFSIEEHSDKINAKSQSVNFLDGQSSKISSPDKQTGSKKKSKRRKYSGSCEMKILNSSTLLVEPLESRKFARVSLQYTDTEEKLSENDQWEPRFSGHQSLKERELSFIAHDQKINCGFVKGPKGSPSTGFDLAEDDAKYISSCHIAVVSCIFGNSDRLRSPTGKMVSKLSRKNVCFVMFVDEYTLQTLSSEGQMPDRMGFIGLWKIVVVKNLPYTDMRRVGKIPKLLSHRLFPSARYSIWLDSKLRLQLDPLLILEYLLWRKGFEYAISNHYDRHCVWEEVAQNKKLNKYNHTVIDEQFSFYQADGLKRFNASDPNKLLPSNVPEGSLIVRAHTPMSNLFSCLWFNEVDRFTPRDQLSFAYTYYKMRKTNLDKHFYLNMFKDCERRKIAKLFHHRSEEKRSMPQHDTE